MHAGGVSCFGNIQNIIALHKKSHGKSTLEPVGLDPVTESHPVAQELTDIIRAHMGEQTSPALR